MGTDVIHGWWTAHARGEFPRHLWEGRGPWILVQSEDAWIPALDAAAMRGSEAHTTVNPGLSAPQPYITKILLETDEPDVAENHRVALIATRLLMVDYGALPRVYFSGGKSFHIYVDFEPFGSRDPGEVAAEWAMEFAKSVSEQAGRPVEFDSNVIRGVHMSRLPFFPRADGKGTPIPVDLRAAPLDRILGLSRSWERDPRPGAIPGPGTKLSSGTWLALLRVWERIGDPDEVQALQGLGPAPPGSKIRWIEAVLSTPFEDGRKRLISLVLAPYLRYTQGMDPGEAEAALVEWLKLSGVSDSAHLRLARQRARGAGDHPPMSRRTLKERYPDLYELIRRRVPEIESGPGASKPRPDRIPEDEI